MRARALCLLLAVFGLLPSLNALVPAALLAPPVAEGLLHAAVLGTVFVNARARQREAALAAADDADRTASRQGVTHAAPLTAREAVG